MPITIIDGNNRFNCRAGAIIYNEERTKILLENQDNKRLVFPGGRIDMNEDSLSALKRELKEELNIEVELSLRFVLELFNKNYHEIGFYYMTQISEDKIEDNTKSNDYSGIFHWFPIEELEKYEIVATPIKNRIITKNIPIAPKHIIYKE